LKEIGGGTVNKVLTVKRTDDTTKGWTALELALEVQQVTKFFGGRSYIAIPNRRPKERIAAINNVSLKVRRGEIYGILGANGSGKSTLIRLIATLLLPDAGTITVFDHDVVHEAAVVRRMINRVSVEASLFKKLSAMENLLYAARLYSVNARTARREIVRILEALGIPATRIGEPVEKMSRGMQQKVAIARALLTSPVLLLLDEPTTGLDPRSKKDVQQFIRELREAHDATVLLTTHDMTEADSLCDRLAILDTGRIVVEGTPQQLKADFVRRQNGLTILPSLEDVFMEVTGRSLEEDQEGGVE
jgi:ABC-2 type transport system ATP-binding protein